MDKHIFKRIGLYRNINYYVLMRGLYWFLKSKILKRPNLKYMDVALDYSCNMKCQHCFALKLANGDKSRLSIEQYQRIAKGARSIGCLHFNLQGGEPLIMDNLSEYIKAFKPHLCYVSITTNGYLFSKEKAHSLKKSGVRQIVFSLDSLDVGYHDDFRQLKGSYARVMQGIKLAREMKFGVSVNVTVSHVSLQEEKQKELFQWLHSEKIPYNPIFACPVGRWTGQMELMLTSQDVVFINSLRRKYGLAQRDIQASWVKEGCSAIAEQIYLTPYGDIMPCPFIPISVGNVQEESIASIWRRLMLEGIYGGYSEKCWVAENKNFARELGELCANYKNLPISCKDLAGQDFLSSFWKNI